LTILVKNKHFLPERYQSGPRQQRDNAVAERVVTIATFLRESTSMAARSLLGPGTARHVFRLHSLAILDALTNVWIRQKKQRLGKIPYRYREKIPASFFIFSRCLQATRTPH
jgi:hypothetical protein